MDPKLTAAYIFAILFDVAMPMAFALYAHRRLGVSWRYFWYGALIFFLFQMITRVPAVQLIQGLLAGPLSRSPLLVWVWTLTLALTAGLFEEGGRYLGYRHLIFRAKPSAISHRPSAFHRPEPANMPEGTLSPLQQEAEGVGPEPRTTGPEPPGLRTQDSALESWKKGVMYGLGHGGLESMLLVGGMVLLGFLNAVAITRMDPASVAALPPGQAAQVQQLQVSFRTMAWWMPLLGTFERLCTVGIQVAFSILVLQCFLRGSLRWLYLAVGAHFLVDFVTVVAAPRMGPVAAEGIVALFALAALYLIFRLRPKPATSPA